MNKPIIKKWITELKKFLKEPTYKRLLFPMRMESAKGDLYSPEGILCELHAQETKSKWLPEKPEVKGQLRGHLFYFKSIDSAPKEVLDWVGISGSQMSTIRTLNGEGSFEKVISHLEGLCNGEEKQKTKAEKTDTE